METQATEPAAASTEPTVPKAPQKTAVIALTAGKTTLTLLARRLRDGTAVTTVSTRADGDKHSTRGMTERHATFEQATVVITTRAIQAEKLGWTRPEAGRGFVPKPDAFATLPAAPKGKK